MGLRKTAFQFPLVARQGGVEDLIKVFRNTLGNILCARCGSALFFFTLAVSWLSYYKCELRLCFDSVINGKVIYELFVSALILYRCIFVAVLLH